MYTYFFFCILFKSLEANETIKEKVFSASSFETMKLMPHIVDCLKKRFELKRMTRIQENTIPAILDGQDCFVKSQTGSGKTLAYAIPIIQRLATIKPNLKRTDGIKALVLVPTREVSLDLLFLGLDRLTTEKSTSKSDQDLDSKWPFLLIFLDFKHFSFSKSNNQ